MNQAEAAMQPELEERKRRKRVGILFSGTGTNMKALLRHTGVYKSSVGLWEEKPLDLADGEEGSNDFRFPKWISCVRFMFRELFPRMDIQLPPVKLVTSVDPFLSLAHDSLLNR